MIHASHAADFHISNAISTEALLVPLGVGHTVGCEAGRNDRGAALPTFHLAQWITNGRHQSSNGEGRGFYVAQPEGPNRACTMRRMPHQGHGLTSANRLAA